jgi:hypothetical protein
LCTGFNLRLFAILGVCVSQVHAQKFNACTSRVVAPISLALCWQFIFTLPPPRRARAAQIKMILDIKMTAPTGSVPCFYCRGRETASNNCANELLRSRETFHSLYEDAAGCERTWRETFSNYLYSSARYIAKLMHTHTHTQTQDARHIK